MYLGALPLEEASINRELQELLSWADGFKRLGVRANADTPEAIKRATHPGIGLCRTERMFNAPERLAVIRRFILAEDEDEQAKAIKQLRELQTKDFIKLFKALNGAPIIIRLLDLPLHEFLPGESEVKDPQIKRRVAELKETNPMLGHRGVRLAVTKPELYEMQIEAVEKALKATDPAVSIMIPQVITIKRRLQSRELLYGRNFKIGVMMETVGLV